MKNERFCKEFFLLALVSVVGILLPFISLGCDEPDPEIVYISTDTPVEAPAESSDGAVIDGNCIQDALYCAGIAIANDMPYKILLGWNYHADEDIEIYHAQVAIELQGEWKWAKRRNGYAELIDELPNFRPDGEEMDVYQFLENMETIWR